MSYSILFSFKIVLIKSITRNRFVLKTFSFLLSNYIYSHLHLRNNSKYLKIYSLQNIVLICPKLKILKLINKEIESSLVTVEEYIQLSVKFIKIIYNCIKNSLRSYVCPKCYQRQSTIGP